jgi:hypothetical protein
VAVIIAAMTLPPEPDTTAIHTDDPVELRRLLAAALSDRTRMQQEHDQVIQEREQVIQEREQVIQERNRVLETPLCQHSCPMNFSR